MSRQSNCSLSLADGAIPGLRATKGRRCYWVVMGRYPGRNYFIVKHDLASLQAMPGRVWNSYEPPDHFPVGFRQMEEGDRWIAFAYTSSDAREKAVSMVTGFYEVTEESEYARMTSKAQSLCGRKKWAWIIRGKSLGRPPEMPVVIPPISNFVGQRMFHRRTITRISKKVFDEIRKYTLSHRFDPGRIPCLGREPLCEQEVIAVIVAGAKHLGIDKILRIRTRFPDMLVKLRGKTEPVHLEVEVYSSSFNAHGHANQVRAGKYRGDRKPVAVLCWVDDAKAGIVKRRVHKIYELQTLIRDGLRIRW